MLVHQRVTCPDLFPDLHHMHFPRSISNVFNFLHCISHSGATLGSHGIAGLVPSFGLFLPKHGFGEITFGGALAFVFFRLFLGRLRDVAVYKSRLPMPKGRNLPTPSKGYCTGKISVTLGHSFEGLGFLALNSEHICRSIVRHRFTKDCIRKRHETWKCQYGKYGSNFELQHGSSVDFGGIQPS